MPGDHGRRSFLSISGDNVVVETIKAVEDGDGLIGLYEAQNQRVQLT